MGVNLHAPFLMSPAVLPSMVEHGWGRLINYSGIAGFRGATGTTAKMAAEGGLSFPPGPRDPITRWGTPEELAFPAVSLASDQAGYATGQCMLAHGGKYFL